MQPVVEDKDCLCRSLHSDTYDSDDRVYLIADAAPNCGCESHSISTYSPGPIEKDELIGRMVCSPMHVHRNRKELKPNFFDHAFSFGLSVQRLKHASQEELIELISGFLSPKEDRVWLGYVSCSFKSLQMLESGSTGKRMFCVYDSGEENNPAHAEIGSSHRINEADRIEHRVQLMRAFGDGEIDSRESLCSGSVFTGLEDKLRERSVPNQWR